MKLNFGLLCSILTCSFITVYADNQNDFFKYCERACNIEFLPKLVKLLNSTEILNSEYDNIDPYWNECQYRCYRCYLPTAAKAMRYLKNLFRIEYQNIAIVIENVDQSLRSCYNQWKDANEAEDFESTFE
ncbi:hypothetical protein BDF21DRAFT_486627 [Thamnidium elegans]|nr:hypothetical protein BDF21DRAFT_486627 [Thamnidium elegans]